MQSVRIDIQPEDLLTRPVPGESHWFAVLPRAGRSRVLINGLYKFEKAFCSFLIPEPISGMELLPDLVFLNGRQRDRDDVLKMPCVERTRPIQDEEQLWCDLRCIHRGLVDSKYVARTPDCPSASRFRVTTGPLEGWDGLLGHKGHRANAFLLPAGAPAWDLLESLAAPLSRLRKVRDE